MAECRYNAMCDMCGRAGDDWLPCDGTDDGATCGHFEPMPDVAALLALADELEAEGLDGWASGPVDVGRYARRIREALGADDGL